MRLKRLAVLVLALTLPMALWASGRPEAAASGVGFRQPVNIGTKNFTEQYIVGNLMAILLEDRGFDVDLKTGMSTTVLREALINGDIDLCMEYTGTGWLTHMQNEFAGESPKEMFEQVRAADADDGIVWIDPIWCNNTYVIALPGELAAENDLETLSDFAEYVESQGGNVSISTTNEFYARPDGIQGMEELYEFSFSDDAVTPVQPGVQKKYLIDGEVDSTVAFGTDAEIGKYGWAVMQDDKNFWPPYDLSPTTRTEVLEANDGLEKALKDLIKAFPKDPAEARKTMAELNAKVDIDKLEPEEVAEEWLKAQGLI
jgi:osmoprotectant transport system substrate-binding protein